MVQRWRRTGQRQVSLQALQTANKQESQVLGSYGSMTGQIDRFLTDPSSQDQAKLELEFCISNPAIPIPF